MADAPTRDQYDAPPAACWILRCVRASVPLLGEPVFRWGVSHRDVAG